MNAEMKQIFFKLLRTQIFYNKWQKNRYIFSNIFMNTNNNFSIINGKKYV